MSVVPISGRDHEAPHRTWSFESSMRRTVHPFLRMRLTFAVHLSVLLGLVGLPIGAGAQAPPALGFEDAMARAEAHSRALPAQQAAARAARERAVAAGQRPDPVWRIGLDNVPVEGGTEHLLTRESGTARSIGVVQALPDAAKRAARSRRFEQDEKLALVDREARRADLRRETALAWFAVDAEQKRLALIDAQRVDAALVVQAAESAYRTGRSGQAEVFIARALPARLDDQRLDAQARLDTARSALRRWVGPAADGPLGTAPSISRYAPEGGIPAQALAGDPQLLSAVAREHNARAMVDVAREERRADWSVDLRFQQRGPRFDNMVTFGLSMPLRWDLANRQDREVAARQAEVEQAEAETEELRRRRMADVERWTHRWRAGLARLAGVDGVQLPLAAARADAALAAYRAGGGSLEAVLVARQADLALRLERVQIESDTASDWARLITLIPPPEAAR